MADIRMYVDAIHYAVERLGFTELKSLQLKVALAIVTFLEFYQLVIGRIYAFLYSSIACVRLKKRNR